MEELAFDKETKALLRKETHNNEEYYIVIGKYDEEKNCIDYFTGFYRNYKLKERLNNLPNYSIAEKKISTNIL